MMETKPNGAALERVDFSKIKTSVPIPNLIEVQKKSYERFLQMDLLPSERDDTGLQSVFNSVFPISDFRGLSQLEFVDYSIGNWECKCGNLKGCTILRSTCRNPACGATIRTDPFHAGDVLCHKCGTFNKNIVTFCNRCGDPVGLQLKYDVPECERARHDVRRATESNHPAYGLRQGSGNRRQERPRHQGTGSLLRRNPVDDRKRHLHHQRHRARHRFPVAPFAPASFLNASRPRATSSARSFRTAAVGSNSNTTTRTCCSSVSIASASFTALSSARPRPEVGFGDHSCLLPVQRAATEGHEGPVEGQRLSGRPEAVARHQQQERATPSSPQGRKITPSLSIANYKSSTSSRSEVALNDLEGAFVAADVIDMETGEILAEANHELTSTMLTKIMEAGIDKVRNLLPRARRCRQRHFRHHPQGCGQNSKRRAARNLPQVAPGRSADPRYGHAAVPGHVLRPPQVRLLARRPHEVQHQDARQRGRNVA